MSRIGATVLGFLLVLAMVACGDDDDNRVGPEPEPDVSGDGPCEWDQVPVEGGCCDLRCDGRACGDNGCGGSCGTCLGNDVCVEGWCVCQPACDYPKGGLECGYDGCGGFCGCGEALCRLDGQCCTPSCDDRACGDDGCGGSCGWCPGGVCVEGGCEPAPLAPAAHLRTLAFALPDGGDDPAGCADLNGDGLPDAGTSVVLGTLTGFGVDGNGELAESLDSGALRLALVAEGLDAIGDGPSRFVIYLGAPGSDPTMTAMTDALGAPLYVATDATWGDDGTLTVGEGTLTLPYRIGSLDAPLPIEHTRLRLGGIELEDQAWSAARGSLSGLLFKADVDRWLFTARTWCLTDPNASAATCGYIQMADLSLIETFVTWDMWEEGCGKPLQIYDVNDPMVVVGTEENCQALSVCMSLSAIAGRVAAPTGGPGVLRLVEPDPLDPGVGSGPVITCGCRLSTSRPATDASALGIALVLLLSAILYALGRRLWTE